MNVDTQSLLTLSGAGAGTYSTGDRPNGEWRSISVAINLTTVTSASVTPTLWGKDPVSGLLYPLLPGLAVTVAGLINLQFGPGLINTAVSANGVLPKTYRITLGVVGASAVVSGTVSASLVL